MPSNHVALEGIVFHVFVLDVYESSHRHRTHVLVLHVFVFHV